MTRAQLLFIACLSCILMLALCPVSAAAEWKESVLYSFQGIPDGAGPIGGFVFDSAGNLYGATQDGGAKSCVSANQCGTIYQLTPPRKKGDPWTETVLYVFKGNTAKDGTSPFGGLVIDSAGNLYGTTGYGGTGNCVLLGIMMGCGTVFELSPPSHKGGAWTETILYSFPNAKKGYLPNGDLVFDSAGNLYGATMFGGGRGTNCNVLYQYCGAIFELSPPKKKAGRWTEKVLYSFKGVNAEQNSGDGANPNGYLVLDSTGSLYGTTYVGGNNQQGVCRGGTGGTGCGIVFKLSPPAQEGAQWNETILHRMGASTEDGSNPVGGLALDSDGNLFGATFFGPKNGYGTVFEVAKPIGKSDSWKETLLYRFTHGVDGSNPDAGLIFDSKGALHGTTAQATTESAQGTVFHLKPPARKGDSWVLGTNYTFQGPPDGARPSSKLVVGKNGGLFGTTQIGGTASNCGTGNCGTVFEVKP